MTRTRSRLVLVACAALCACGSSGAPLITAATRVSPTPATTPVPSAPQTPSSVPVSRLLTSCPKTRPFSSLKVFAKVSEATDLAVGADGSVWVASSSGLITHLAPIGAKLGSYAALTPRGIVPLSNGDILFADHDDDSIIKFDPVTLARTTFLQLAPKPGVPTIQGLEADVAAGLLLVPDTSAGQLLSVPLTGGQPTVLTTGLSLPVDAAVGPNGVIDVAGYGQTGLVAVPLSGGAATPYKNLTVMAAVVTKGQLVYLDVPRHNEILAFNPATDHSAILVSGIPDPAGLAMLANGDLVVSDAISGKLAEFAGC
jgi:hypothetical protein